jgi:ribonuclease H / adenosylcobalamin/alpha-ribazole phosphatase
MASHRTLVVEADGGSRGNPGPAAYGGVVRDARSGEVLVTFAEPVGVTTNNVAEYRGLITGLRRAREIDPDALVEARLDSRLVVEQMSGRWKIKHPDMRALALEARQAFPPEQVSYVWVPREQNALADRLLNEALDAAAHSRGAGWSASATGSGVASTAVVEPPTPSRGWGPPTGEAATLLLARHGDTALTAEKRFSGVRGDPELTEYGREQARRLGDALAHEGGVDVVVSSTLLRARETADIAGSLLGLDVVEDEGWRETDFGDWDGFTFAEIARRWPDELTAWLDSPTVPPTGGESFEQVASRVRAARARLVQRHLGRTVLVVTHVTPVKAMVCATLGAPLSALYRMELGSAALSSVAWYPDGNASLRSFNDTSHLDPSPATRPRR